MELGGSRNTLGDCLWGSSEIGSLSIVEQAGDSPAFTKGRTASGRAPFESTVDVLDGALSDIAVPWLFTTASSISWVLGLSPPNWPALPVGLFDIASYPCFSRGDNGLSYCICGLHAHQGMVERTKTF